MNKKQINKIGIFLIIKFLNLIISTSIFAQVPEKMSYQAVVRDASDNLITNTTVGMQISILQDSSNGTPVYVETQTPGTNANGLVSIELGAGTVVSGDIININWPGNTFFLKTETDPTGGTNYTITGTSQLLSVPYVFHSKTADGYSGHYIGEIFGGGIVFYVYDNGKHGLIASLDDLDGGSGEIWSNRTVEIGSAAKSLTNGANNTLAIIGQSGHTTSAAKLCADYSIDGFDDWYLPSARELHLLAKQDILIDNILDNDGDSSTNGFVQENVSPIYGRYWSSSETYAVAALYYDICLNEGGSDNKAAFSYRVRAIRAF